MSLMAVQAPHGMFSSLHDHRNIIILIPKRHSILKSPVSNSIKVPAGMQRAKVGPMALKPFVVLEGEYTSITLTHQVCPQHFDAMVCTKLVQVRDLCQSTHRDALSGP